ncbi:MAG: DUF6443 domain-containing protein, partial [Prevotellaceae bacterium]|nr:DUF6443 domain-containing protein [Prevotellaceae bacterium]
MKRITLIILTILISVFAYSQKTGNLDMKTLKIDPATLPTFININDRIIPYTEQYGQNYRTTFSISSGIETREYFDGLGRLQEVVVKEVTPSNKDLATKYDYEGRKVIRSWLPVAVGNNNCGFVTNFKTKAIAQYADNRPFAETKKEVFNVKQTRAGEDWENKQSEMNFLTNTDGEVKIFEIFNGQINFVEFYPANELIKMQVKDEDNKTAWQFTDQEGKTILTMAKDGEVKHETYYVYDDFGQLRCVLPPLATDEFTSVGTSFNQTADEMKNLAYFYKYDKYGNCIEKKIPNAEPVLYVYDKANRLILSQDGNLRNQGKWTVIKYDIYGRVLYTGIMETEQSVEDLRLFLADKIVVETPTTKDDLIFKNTKKNFLEINEKDIKAKFFKYKLLATFERIGYTSDFFSGQITPLIVNYYDNYSFLGILPDEVKEELNFDAYGLQSSILGINYLQEKDNAKGLLTGTRTYLLDNSGDYIVSATYYDWLGLPIQTRSTNHLSGYDIVNTKYNYVGNPILTIKNHSAIINGVSQARAEEYVFEYDNALRLKKTTYKLNGNSPVLLAENVYDELGRLQKKQRHNFTDSETFNYNIQNWLTTKTSGVFEQAWNYTFAGNIDAQAWKNSDNRANKYNYQYDGLNRLTSGSTPTGYGESFSYDKNGNIESLVRLKGGTTIDNLEMEYTGNKLEKITENMPTHPFSGQNSLKEYIQKGDGTFKYDSNGNLIFDADRKILSIKYNLLNLPSEILFENGSAIFNIYAADARKLSS